jgi:glucose/arabinose dehydrogenase
MFQVIRFMAYSQEGICVLSARMDSLMRWPPLVPILGALCALFLCAPLQAQRLPVERVRLPQGFAISVFADNLPGARSLALGRGNVVFVGTRGQGRVYALRHDGARATRVITLASGLNMPNGVALKDGALYVAEVSRILRFDAIEAQLERGAIAAPAVVTERFPRDAHHGWKFIAFGPDGRLYVPVGAPCNICAPDPERHALISRINADGSGYEVVARGVRNSVGFDWHPQTGELWFTDNGRDWLGDDSPDDELNHAPRAGLHFGYPYCHQGDLADPEFGRGRSCAEFVAPVAKLGPHVAALGMRFYTGSQFPAEYRNNIFIAEHGSWNRSTKIGYRIKRVVLDGAKLARQEVFAEGWLEAGDRVWGRPVDVAVMPDGSLLVSDDYAGAIYRIEYRGR